MSSPDLPDLANRLTSGDLFTAANAGLVAADAAVEPDTDIVATFYSNTYGQPERCGDYSSLRVAWPRNDVETGRIVLKGGDPLIPIARACSRTVVPVTIEAGYMLFNGRVTDTDYAMDAQGNWTCTCTLTGDTNYLNHVLCWVNFITPIEYQGPLQDAIYAGPACSVIEALITEQCWRLQLGLYGILNNLSSFNANWRAWFGSWLESNGDIFEMLTTPVYVVHHDIVLDTSPWVAILGRFDIILDLIKQTIKDNGLDLEVKLWRKGDPQPDPHANLKVATYVVTVRDRSGITGPTQTFVDGLLEDVAQLQQGAFGQNLSPFEGAAAQRLASEGIYIAPEIGVDFTPPWAMIVMDHPKTPLISAHIYDHHTMAYQLVIGGKSPQWLDDFINETLEWFVDAIQILVGITGIPDTLFDGLFDDTIDAFELVDNADRRGENGPYCYPEQMFPSVSTPYNVLAWLSLIEAGWDTRGWTAAKVSFLNGFPLKVGRDVFRGGLMALALMEDAVVHMDYVENIELIDDRKTRARVEVSVGDGKLGENPMTIFQRKITDAVKSIKVLTLSSN